MQKYEARKNADNNRYQKTHSILRSSSHLMIHIPGVDVVTRIKNSVRKFKMSRYNVHFMPLLRNHNAREYRGESQSLRDERRIRYFLRKQDMYELSIEASGVSTSTLLIGRSSLNRSQMEIVEIDKYHFEESSMCAVCLCGYPIRYLLGQ